MKIRGFRDTIDWYDKNAEQYNAALNAVIPTDSINWFISYLPTSPKILEVGCAAGRESKVFLENGVNVTGIDLSKKLLKIAKRNNPSAKYIEGNFLDLPFENEEFDGIWSHASLVHLETLDEVERAFSEFKRVLKPGGFLYIYVKEQTGKDETAIVTDKLSKHNRFFRYYRPEKLKTLPPTICHFRG